MIHILKIKGTKKIPDFVQIRDRNLSLVAYFRPDQIDRGKTDLTEKGLKKNNIIDHDGKLKDFINKMPFNRVCKYIIDE
tara:strand:- start:78 stop:314 length:237 start_codon:yes stop_codon:yes gene_type:complete